jgi:hypothetical protein
MGMRESHIKLLLQKKLKSWQDSIVDSAVKEAVKKDTIVTGGAIASMLLGEKVNDYDIYFKTIETTKLVAEYYADLFNATKGKLKSVVSKSHNPEVKVVRTKNIKNEEEDRVVLYMKSAGVAGESEEAYRYFEGTRGQEAETYLSEIFDVSQKELVDQFEQIKEDVKDKTISYAPLFLTDNAITLSGKIQIIIRFYGDAAAIHKNFDFVHAMSYYDWNSNHLELPQETLKALLSKTLVYKGSLYPIASVFRTRKFIERGWRISAGQLLKMLVQISRLDLSDTQLLRDQLIGVDVAYMHELISAIENHSGRIDDVYLASLIDKIFD